MHPLNTCSPTDVKEAENFTLVKAEHPLNAQLSMDVRKVEERSTLAKAEQSENALYPMDVKEAGNFTLVKASQS